MPNYTFTNTVRALTYGRNAFADIKLGANVIDPLTNELLVKNFRALSSSAYLHAEEAWNTWCNDLGFDPLESTYDNFSSEYFYSSGVIFDAVPCLGGSVSPKVFMGGAGSVGLWRNTPLVTGLNSTTTAGIGSSPILLKWRAHPAKLPVFFLGVETSSATYTYMTGVCRAHYTGNTLILYFQRYYATTPTDLYYTRVAMRIRPHQIDCVMSQEENDRSVNERLQLVLLTFNEVTGACTGAKRLANEHWGTVHYQSEDVSDIHPLVTEGIGMGYSSSTQWTVDQTVSDAINVAHSRAVARVIPLSEGIGLDEDNTITAVRPAAIIETTLRFQDAVTVSGIFGMPVNEAIRITDQLRAAIPATVQEGVGVARVVTITRGVLVAERLGLARTLANQATIGATVAETLIARDSLARFFGADVTEGVGMADAASQSFRALRTVSEGIGLDDEVTTPRLILRVDVEEGVAFDDTVSLNALLGATITEGVRIHAAYISPNGNFTTWVVNTRTGAVSEYTNFSFNSFARMGLRYIGASSTGIYELVGDDDAGVDILARLKSGYAQFGGSHLTSIDTAYLGIRGDGDYILKVDTGDGKSYTYQVKNSSMQTTKVRMGKGIRARYISFELENVAGAVFDLDTIEFIPLVARRRV